MTPQIRIGLCGSVVIFAACLGLGLIIARHKPLWNDEYYSQVSSIEGISYADQLLGRIPEGGNAPLFYSLQKFFLQFAGYHTPAAWTSGYWSSDLSSQMLLRVLPVGAMALSGTAIFYYFYAEYSLILAIFGFFLFLSSYMVWTYWAEARPYALLVFLTTVQSIVLLKKIRRGKEDRYLWMGAAGVNILLALTSIMSLGQIMGFSLLWWAAYERDWKKYILLTFVPVALVLFYYSQAPKYQFFFGSLSPEQLFRDNISRDRVDALFIFLISLGLYGAQKVKAKIFVGPQILEAVPYLIFMSLVIAWAFVVMGIFAVESKDHQGFPIISRYFIYLTPIGIIATTLMSRCVLRALSAYRWAQAVVTVILGLAFAKELVKVSPNIIHALR